MLNPFYIKNSKLDSVQSSMSDFEIICELGRGSFGTVYKVKRRTDNNIYALKKVYLNQLKPKEKENSLNEIRILASINNKNIVQYKESFFDRINNCLCLVMEYAECGDLEKKISIRQRKNLYFSEFEILNMIIQIIKGLKSLHDYKIMHRDIKSANIFLFNDNIVKIGDLNVSKILKNNLHNTQTGTPYYASPEVWDNKSYDFKSDIWSLGCLIYEICSLKAPFRGTSMKIVYDKVMKGIYDPIPKIYSRALSGIVYICLQTNPINRPTCAQLLNIIDKQISMFNLEGRKISVNNNEGMPYNGKKCDDNCEIIQNENVIIEDKFDFEKNFYHNDEDNKLLNTIKMPKRLNDINLFLPKNRYSSSTTRRNIQSAVINMRNRLPKIQINESKDYLSFINDKYTDKNENENNHFRKITDVEKNKILNYYYSESNVINPSHNLKNIRNKYNNINYLYRDNSDINIKNSVNLLIDDIKKDINFSENVNSILEDNSQKNINKNYQNNNNNNENDKKLLEEIENQKSNLINYHFIQKNIQKSNSNNNIFSENGITSPINPMNNIINEKKNNKNNLINYPIKIPQRSQSHTRYNLSYLNQLTENNNKDISLININFNNLSYINNINNNNYPIKTSSKNVNEYNSINLKKKFIKNNNNSFIKERTNNERNTIKEEQNEEGNEIFENNLGKINNKELNENKNVNPIKKYENNNYIKKQRNFQELNNIFTEEDKKRAISAFHKRNIFQRDKFLSQGQNNYSFLVGNAYNLNNIEDNLNQNKSSNNIIDSNSPNKKEKNNIINYNSFNRKINRNSLNIKKNFNNFYNNNNQFIIDSIKLRTRNNNESNINLHLPKIGNNLSKNDSNKIYDTINLNNLIEKQKFKQKENLIYNKLRNNNLKFHNFKKIHNNKIPIKVNIKVDQSDDSLIKMKKNNVIQQYNDTEILDNNVKKLMKDFKIIEEE